MRRLLELHLLGIAKRYWLSAVACPAVFIRCLNGTLVSPAMSAMYIYGAAPASLHLCASRAEVFLTCNKDVTPNGNEHG